MPYSRVELLQAVRTDHPEFKDVPDNKLFAAIAVDHPDLARGISELQAPPEAKKPSLSPEADFYNNLKPGEFMAGLSKLGHVLMNTAPGADTGNAPTSTS